MFLENRQFRADKHMTAVWKYNLMWLDFKLNWNMQCTLSMSKCYVCGSQGGKEITEIILLRLHSLFCVVCYSYIIGIHTETHTKNNSLDKVQAK